MSAGHEGQPYCPRCRSLIVTAFRPDGLVGGVARGLIAERVGAVSMVNFAEVRIDSGPRPPSWDGPPGGPARIRRADHVGDKLSVTRGR